MWAKMLTTNQNVPGSNSSHIRCYPHLRHLFLGKSHFLDHLWEYLIDQSRTGLRPRQETGVLFQPRQNRASALHTRTCLCRCFQCSPGHPRRCPRRTSQSPPPSMPFPFPFFFFSATHLFFFLMYPINIPNLGTRPKWRPSLQWCF